MLKSTFPYIMVILTIFFFSCQSLPGQWRPISSGDQVIPQTENIIAIVDNIRIIQLFSLFPYSHFDSLQMNSVVLTPVLFERGFSLHISPHTKGWLVILEGPKEELTFLSAYLKDSQGAELSDLFKNAPCTVLRLSPESFSLMDMTWIDLKKKKGVKKKRTEIVKMYEHWEAELVQIRQDTLSGAFPRNYFELHHNPDWLFYLIASSLEENWTPAESLYYLPHFFKVYQQGAFGL